ncbi:hypothetical protein K502DRAFT_356733 [Neoconidiobolus thromboides FSU 785]|nr:hypothetical protein K502DRAFT_356733 [Neoconidiobolus thromboides FSU 785]
MESSAYSGEKIALEDLSSSQSVLDEMVHLSAVVYEISRFILMTPTINRKISKTVIFENNPVLKPAQSIMIHIGSTVKDPNLLNNPNEFQPERFLIVENKENELTKN